MAANGDRVSLRSDEMFQNLTVVTDAQAVNVLNVTHGKYYVHFTTI